MSALVIKAWRAEPKPIDNQGTFVAILGRQGGFFAWFLSLLRIDPTTRIVVGFERVEFSSSSLAGTESRLIPLEGICSSYYGYHKPWKAAASIIATFMFFGLALAMPAEDGSQGGGTSSFMVVTAVGVVIALIYYFLNRTLTFGFVEHSGVVNGIRFKRSVIENVDINEEQARTACIIVQRLIEAKHKRGLTVSKPQ